jgi:holo-[acyl-carrier protein] synthase
MIIGLGSDLIDIRRVDRTIERFGARFLSRIFTPVEREKSDRRAQRAASYAGNRTAPWRVLEGYGSCQSAWR